MLVNGVGSFSIAFFNQYSPHFTTYESIAMYFHKNGFWKFRRLKHNVTKITANVHFN